MRQILLLLLLLPLVAGYQGGVPELDDVQERVQSAPEQTVVFAEAAVERNVDRLTAQHQSGQEEAQERQDQASREGDATLSSLEDTQAAAEAFAEDAVATVDRLGLRDMVNMRLDQLLQEAETLVPAEEAAQEEFMTPQAAAKNPNPFTPTQAAFATATAAATAVILWIVSSKSAAPLVRRDIHRIIPIAAPLFTRFERTSVLEHPNREAMYALIQATPGLSLQALCDATTLSRTAVAHHLRLMEQSHVIVSKRVGRSRHYYENGGRYGRDQKEAYAVLQNDRSKDVAKYIQSHPGSMQRTMCEALEIQPSIAHWHVRRLAEAGLVEPVRDGRTVQYFPGSTLQGIEL